MLHNLLIMLFGISPINFLPIMLIFMLARYALLDADNLYL